MIASAEMTDYKTISDYAFLNKQKSPVGETSFWSEKRMGAFLPFFFFTPTFNVLKTALFPPLLKFYFLLGLAGCIFDTSDNISCFTVK